jgi:hypothetical protein
MCPANKNKNKKKRILYFTEMSFVLILTNCFGNDRENTINIPKKKLRQPEKYYNQ